MKSLFLIILMVLPKVVFANEDGMCGEYATYHFDEQNHTLTISGYGEMYKYESEEAVPWQSYKDNITEVVIESGITSIGDYAFAYCSGLNSVSLPSSIEVIDRYAFNHCKGLSQLTIPPYIQCIEEYAFSSSDIANVYIPNSCLYIKKFAFYKSLIENIEIEFRGNGSPTLLSIGDFAFGDCPLLLSVNLGATLVDISTNNPFALCYSLTTFDGWGVYTNDECGYDIKDGCLYRFSERGNNLELICCPGGKNSWTATEHLKAIGNYAFAGCKQITNFDIPNTVKTIGAYAFALSNNTYDSTYHRVFIPESVEEIGSNVWGFWSRNFDIYMNNTKIKSFDCMMITILGTLHIPYRTKALFDIDKLKNNFTIFDDINDDNITIEDEMVFDNDFVRENTTITYARTFSNTNWQALYVPFAIPVDSLTKNGLQVAELNDTHQWDWDGDGNADSTRLEFFTLKSGSTEPNYPYLIKADETMELVLNLKDTEVKASEEKSYECSSLKQRFTFVGTYAGVSGAEMYSNNYYGMAGGGLKRVSDATVSLKPHRWYMKIENKNGSPVSYYAPSIRFSVDGIENEPETTGIASMMSGNREEGEKIFSLDGIRHMTGSLKPGLYVHQGKKLVIR